MGTLIIYCAAILSTLIVIVVVWRSCFVVAQPDEWLICVRRGRLLHSGVGIALWRWPGDIVARFSSTVQRVTFSAEALTREHLAVTIEGFALWSVSSEGDDPFIAFSKLGIANLNRHPEELRSPRHLLTKAQYRAFQTLLAAEIQQEAAKLSLVQILTGRRTLLDGLSERLHSFGGRLGIDIEQVELTGSRPVDETLLTDLGVEQEQGVREDAQRIRRATEERLEQEAIAAEARIAHEKIKKQMEQDAYEAEQELLLSEERARVTEAEAALQKRRRIVRQEQQLAQLEMERAITAKREENALLEKQQKEMVRAAALSAELSRQEQQLEAQLSATRHKAEARRDAIITRTNAESQKPPEVRAHELACLHEQLTAKSLQALPLKEARWISLGESPLTELAALLRPQSRT